MRVARLFNLLAALALFCCIGTAWAAEPGQAPATLNSSDCQKCHEKPPKDIAEKGGKHKTEITCQDCHVGHPPKVKHPIPQCSMCHTGKPHFQLKDCLGCHRNPHTPKVITFGTNVTDACLTCHKPQIEQLKAYPSKHTSLACSFCHNVHGKKPDCTQCHKSHSSDITKNECKLCHKAHQPLNVTYKADTPSKYCAACHKRPFNLLANSTAKHSKLACVYCHQNKHKTVPKCTDCHGVPHPASLMSKFAKCQECHNIAHDLNHWSAPAGGAKPAAPAAKAAPAKKPATKK
ncbi:cytochrome C [Geomesophilobacter sediminis]|uniref:Cytochrome C n=1 Tax=Geomesophilobacter sediminis TaxID=2798584 RepID=A0A8J7S6S5_9BACT|nr:cytochrome C [Geomesophilobacter sediminis]MBJ6726596.1 cytochrome C [Geomesophilobacter sediminis]